MTLTFGKYKDHDIDEVPSDYLEWLVKILRSDTMRQEVEEELRFRRNAAPTQKAAVDIISAGFRALAQKNHPDHGGSNSDMRSLIEARNMLKKTTRG